MSFLLLVVMGIWPVIGWIEDLNRADLSDLQRFFLRWYGPNNAVLTIGGAIDPMETLERRLAILRSSLPLKGIKVNEESPAWSQVQGALARGDERLAAKTSFTVTAGERVTIATPGGGDWGLERNQLVYP